MALARIAEGGAVYHLKDYLAMLSDGTRVAAYARAIAAQVRPGDRVMELGAGFGFFSILAARAGAARVDAVDVNPVVHLGRRIAAANGYNDRIGFHQADLRRFEPQARADVIIADLRGPTPFAGHSLEILIDARRRLLREGGLLIGTRDVLYVAPTRQPAAFLRRVSAPLASAGVDLSPVAAIMRDAPFQCAIAPGDVLAPAASWGELDYPRLEAASHSGTAEWGIATPLEVDGLAVWFEADLGAAAGFSTAPGNAEATYAQLYLPLRTPVHVRSGERLQVEIAARAAGGDYVWAWTIRVCDSDGAARVCHLQNSLAERVIDPAALKTTAL